MGLYSDSGKPCCSVGLNSGSILKYSKISSWGMESACHPTKLVLFLSTLFTLSSLSIPYSKRIGSQTR